MIHSLVDLARETSSDKRRELMQEVSNLFIDGSTAHSDREVLRFGEVLTLLLDQVPLDDRVDFSERIAPLDRTPRDLALKLADDDARVAAPILTHSTALTDQDLAGIARVKGQDHLMAIARREVLSTTVTDVLVDRGDSRVLTTVVRNQGAEFSISGFEQLGEKARRNEALGEALSYRADMPPEVADKVVSYLNPAARARLEALLEQDQDAIDDLMDEARQELDATRGDQRRNRIETKLMVADVRDGKSTADRVVDTLVVQKRMLDIAFVMAELASVPEAHVSNVLHKVNGLGIAVICRTLDISAPVYDRLSRLRCERLRLGARQAEAMARDYSAMDKPTAERTLRFHKVRSAVGA